MDDHTTVLLELYKDNIAQGRHHETQRSTITTVSFAFAGALIGKLASQSLAAPEALPWAVFLAVLGLFAAVLAHKQYERFECHMERARRYRDQLDPSAVKLKQCADKFHNERYPITHRMRLHVLWGTFFLLIYCFGSALTLVVAFKFGWSSPYKGVVCVLATIGFIFQLVLLTLEPHEGKKGKQQ